MKQLSNYSLLSRYEQLVLKAGAMVMKCTIYDVDDIGYPKPEDIEIINKRIECLRNIINYKMW